MEFIISKTLHLRLQTATRGFLVGARIDEEKLLITGCLKYPHEDITNNTIERLESFIPSGFSIIGTFGKDVPSFDSSGYPHLIAHIQTDQNSSPFSNEGAVVICEDENAENMITNHFISFKLKSNMTIHHIDCSDNAKSVRIKKEISKKRSIFHLPNHKLELKGNKLSVGDLLDEVTRDVEVVISKDDDKSTPPPSQGMQYWMTTMWSFIASLLGRSEPEPLSSLPISNIEAVCFGLKSLQSNALVEIFECSLKRMKRKIINCPQLIQSSVISNPQLYQFFLPGWLHQIHICYPTNQTDDQLSTYRRETLHEIFMQPLIPTFGRNLARGQPPHDDDADGKIICPHVGLDESKFSQRYQVAYVQGKYKYYHYMQDGIDDTNWGCAYRSLQTIVSWTKFHGYCNKPVPTHKQIQEILVRIGDKPRRFIGSRNWIGSVEVQRVLEEYTGFSSRIINLTSGSEIIEKGRELLIHFRTHGTPIMIGGGVKAHTIVGVAFDELTGSTQFVVLDPHYEGNDSCVETIHQKGWCNWKKSNQMWMKKSFYNLCLPLRNNQV